MNILILGGTGAIGSFLVKELAKTNHNIYVTTRKSRESSCNVKYIQGNAHDLKFVIKILNLHNWDCIIDFMNYTTEEFKQKYLYFLQKSKQFIFISSSRVYADNDSIITENSPTLLEQSSDKKFLKTDDYALAKARQEKLLKNSGFINYTIIRPYMSYYSNRLDLGFYPKELWLKRALKGKKIIFPKDLLNKYTTLTYGEDVAKGIASIIGVQTAQGEIFHITQNTSSTWKEILNIYLSTLKRNGIECTVKFIETDRCYGYINCYDRQYNRTFDNSKISQYYSTNNCININVGLTKCIETFLHSPNFLNVDWKIYAHWDREVNERTPLSEIPTIKQKLYYILFRYIITFPFLKQLKNIF